MVVNPSELTPLTALVATKLTLQAENVVCSNALISHFIFYQLLTNEHIKYDMIATDICVLNVKTIDFISIVVSYGGRNFICK